MEPLTVEIERKVNGRSVSGKKTYGEKMDGSVLMELLLRDRHFYEESGGGVTFSGGEPLLQIDGLTEILKLCDQRGLHTTLDTSGFAPREHFEKIMPHTDLFLYDLKNMDPELHKKYTGVDNELILDNADFILKNGASVVFRIPVIPGINTAKEELLALIEFLTERREFMKEVHLLPFHRIAENKYARLGMKPQLPGVKEPDQVFMEQLKTKFEETGLEIIIGG